jgi:hypothetical protein
MPLGFPDTGNAEFIRGAAKIGAPQFAQNRANLEN